MTITARGLIQDAFEWIGVFAPGEDMGPADAARGLSRLNQLMDMWSNFSLACYEVLEQSAPLVPGQGSYTIGPGGDFDMTRPLWILGDPGSAYTLDENGNRYSLAVVPRDKWNLFSNVSDLITGNFPNALFYDPQFPLGVINLVPVPNIAYTLYFDSMLQLTRFEKLTTELVLPPGYELAITTNLALMLHPTYLDAQPPAGLVTLAANSLGAIKRTNRRELTAVYDAEIVSRANISYNPYTDAPGSVVR